MLLNTDLFDLMFPTYYKYRVPMWSESEENDDELKIKIVVPGYEKEDFALYAKDDKILLEINKGDDKKVKYSLQAYPYPLEKATAEYRNGILIITIPKAKKAMKELPIKVS
jgi:HSP20 family molecular chaperone IbpA